MEVQPYYASMEASPASVTTGRCWPTSINRRPLWKTMRYDSSWPESGPASAQHWSGEMDRLLADGPGGEENLARDRLGLCHAVDCIVERSRVAISEGEGRGADRGRRHIGREERNRVEGRTGRAIQGTAIGTRGGLRRRDREP